MHIVKETVTLHVCRTVRDSGLQLLMETAVDTGSKILKFWI